MKTFLFLSGILIAISCHAQIKNVSIQAGGNYPLIKGQEENAVSVDMPIPIPNATGYTAVMRPFTGTIKESYSSSVGWQAGGQFDLALGAKFFLTSGLSFNYIRFQRSVEVDLTLSPVNQPGVPISAFNPYVVGEPYGAMYGTFKFRDLEGNPVLTNPLAGTSENVGRTTSLSLQLPLLAGTSFLKDKVEVRMGAVLSYLLHATQVKEQYTGFSNGSLTRSEYKDTSKDTFNEFQAGVMLQTSYRIGQKIGIDFSAQKFFTPIYKETDDSVGKAKYNVLSLGLSYHL